MAALGFHTASTAVPGIPKGADQITVTDSSYGRAIAPGFVGLSLEYTAIPAWAGTDPGAPDPLLVKLLDDLAPGAVTGRVRASASQGASGQGSAGAAKAAAARSSERAPLPVPVLRIGGNSSDWSWYSPHHRPRPPGIRFTLDANWNATTQALVTAAHASIIAGLNLKADDPRLVSDEAAAFATLGRGANTQITFELGNEPEKFGSQTFYVTRRRRAIAARPRRYSFRSYAADFDRFSPLVPAANPLAAPAVGRQSWWPPIPAFLASHPRLKLVTLHVYPLHDCVAHPEGAASPSIPHLLLASASRGAAATVAPYVGPAHRYGARLRIDELNSVSCGGARGVSDTFASALWALDTLFAMAQVGADGVNIHGFPGAAYTPFDLSHRSGRWLATVKPLYLGLLAFVRAAPPGSVLLRVSTPRDPDLRVWATRSRAGGTVHVALINTSPTEPDTIAIELPAGEDPPRLERLSAPGLQATTGVTLAGQSFEPVTQTGELQGDLHVTKPEAIQPRIYLLHLPAASAALLTR